MTDHARIVIVNNIRVYVADLDFVERYEDERLGPEPYQGECAAGVQTVFAEAGKPLGLTRTWRQGLRVATNDIPVGAAIASFQNGLYAGDHAAILAEKTDRGLLVWDQFNNPPKSWSTRLLRFSSSGDRSNNGNLFYTIRANTTANTN